MKKIIDSLKWEFQFEISKYFMYDKIDILYNDSDGFDKYGYAE